MRLTNVHFHEILVSQPFWFASAQSAFVLWPNSDQLVVNVGRSRARQGKESRREDIGGRSVTVQQE